MIVDLLISFSYILECCFPFLCLEFRLTQLISLTIRLVAYDTGEIPRQISDLVNLKIFSLPESNLVGLVPSEIGNLTQLKLVDFSYNNLKGLKPPCLSFCISSVCNSCEIFSYKSL